MNNLSQETYVDGGGKSVTADIVEVLTPYKQLIDGFYQWECAKCGKEHDSRSCGWYIMGQVLNCKGCGTNNLLVPTNIQTLLEGLHALKEKHDKDNSPEVLDEPDFSKIIAEEIGRVRGSLNRILNNEMNDFQRNIRNNVFKKEDKDASNDN